MSRYKSNSIKSHLSTASVPKEEVNIVLLGKQNVGKSALIVKYLTKRFICEYDPFLEDTYWKPDIVDQQEVLVKVMDTYGKDDKRLPYYLKWADAVLITYSITQQDSFEMALAYLDAINSYSKNLSVSSNELVLMLLGNKLDLERSRVIPKAEGEAMAAKFNCAFCETTAADNYEYVQKLFHRTVREVRKERERVVASSVIDEEPSTSSLPTTTTTTANLTNTNFPSPSSSSSSSSSILFPTSPEIVTSSLTTDKPPTSNIPLPPPMPVNLGTHKVARTTKMPKSETQSSITSTGSFSSNTNVPLSTSTIKSGSSSTASSVTTILPSGMTTPTNPSSTPAQPAPSVSKRTPSKTSVFSKIFK